MLQCTPFAKTIEPWGGLTDVSYERLQSMYAGEEYYWGRKPNGFARRALELLPESGKNAKPRAVDIGAGEGRDAVFFAENGMDTLAVDVSSNGLEGVRLAKLSPGAK